MSEVRILEVNEWGVALDGSPMLLRKHAYVCGPTGSASYGGLAGSTLAGAIAASLYISLLRPVKPGGEPVASPTVCDVVPMDQVESEDDFTPHQVRRSNKLLGYIALRDTAEAASPVVATPEALDDHRPSRQMKPR